MVALLLAPCAFASPSQLPPEVGYRSGVQESPRAVAMGGAIMALSNSTDAVLQNPANIAATRVYHVAGLGTLVPRAGVQSYGAAVVDSVVNQRGIAAGLSALWTRQDPDGLKRSSGDFRLSLAAPLGDKFLLGGGLRYLTLSQDGYPRTGDYLEPSVASAGLSKSNIVADVTVDAGATLRPIPELALAVVGMNLTDPGHGFLPLLVGGSVGVGTESFSLEGDVLVDTSSYEKSKATAMFGAEVLLDAIPLRAGYRFEQAYRSHALSAGFGYMTPEFTIDAGFRGVVSGPQALTFSVGFKYHIDAAGTASR